MFALGPRWLPYFAILVSLWCMRPAWMRPPFVHCPCDTQTISAPAPQTDPVPTAINLSQAHHKYPHPYTKPSPR